MIHYLRFMPEWQANLLCTIVAIVIGLLIKKISDKKEEKKKI